MTLKQPTRLFDFPRYQLQNTPVPDALTTKFDGTWKKVSTQEYVEWSEQISRALIEMGVQPDEKIALISSTNRYE